VYPANGRAGLLSQFAYYLPGAGVTVTNAITLSGVPNGTYNLAFHGDDISGGNWGPVGTIFTVHGANGDQSDATTNTGQSTYFINHDTSVVITNVTVTNNLLNVDVTPGPTAGGQCAVNATEIQLVSYGLPTAAFNGTPTIGAAPLAVVFTNTTIGSVTNSAWNFGDGNTVAVASTANVTNTYATAGTYTVSLVVAGLGGVGTLTNTAYIVVTNAAPPVSSDASLSYLALSPLGALTPNFNTTLTNYTATNAIGTTSVTVTVTNTSALATNALFLNGVPQGSPAAGSLAGTVAVAVGSGNVIQVVVTAQDGVTTSTNTVTVTVLPSTNAYLTSLVLNPTGQAGLTTSFVSTTLSYLATNAYGYTPTFTVVNADLTATNSLIYNNITNGLASGVASTTPTLNLTLGVTNVAQVQVTAQDGVTVQTYQVNIVEQPSQTVPHLTNSVSGNNLVLSWPPDHLGYRLLVQTNNLNKGVSGNIGDWGTVPGSTNLTGTSITILKTGVTNMYYKLVYP
jgi:PKD repeat protein